MYHYDKYMGRGDEGSTNESIEKDTSCSSRSASRPAVKYTALSYCWGDMGSNRPITVNNQSIDITGNLWEALNLIWKYHNLSEYYWIDALCLDQTNIEERNHQVHQMWRIYSDAEQVFACAGPEDKSTATAYYAMQFAMANCGSSGMHGYCKCSDRELRDARLEIYTLFNRAYFYRTWIMSEFLHASRLQLICGRFRADNAALEHANASLDNFGFAPQANFLLNLRRTETEGFGPGVINRLITQFCTHSECSQPQDKIFAMLGHSSIRQLDAGILLKPDYSLPLDELFLVVLEWADCLVPSVNHHEIFNNFAKALFAKSPDDKFKDLPVENLYSWIEGHQDWDTSNMPGSVTMSNGRSIDCRGAVLAPKLGGRPQQNHTSTRSLPLAVPLRIPWPSFKPPTVPKMQGKPVELLQNSSRSDEALSEFVLWFDPQNSHKNDLEDILMPFGGDESMPSNDPLHLDPLRTDFPELQNMDSQDELMSDDLFDYSIFPIVHEPRWGSTMEPHDIISPDSGPGFFYSVETSSHYRLAPEILPHDLWDPNFWTDEED